MTGTRSEKRLIGYARVAYAMLNLSRFAARVARGAPTHQQGTTGSVSKRGRTCRYFRAPLV